MKALKYTTGLILASLIFWSCNDEFLTRAPLDEISQSTYWTTESDLESFNNRYYVMTADDAEHLILPGFGNDPFQSASVSIMALDEMSDNFAATHSRMQHFIDIRAGQYRVENSPRIGGWQGWDLLRQINVFLENYQKADVSEPIKNMYAGEARLFRAYFYFDKVKRFGDVPWINKPLNIDSEELFGHRDPREMVVDSSMSDFNFAVEHLPEDRDWGGDPGRLNKWNALLLKSRFALYEGTHRKYHGTGGSEALLQEAADAALEVIENGPYSLYSTGDPYNDYRHSYHQSDLTGNSEVMYWRKYEIGIIDNYIQYYGRYVGGLSKDMVDAYLMKDGLPITQSPLYQGDATISDEFVDRDPRLRQTALDPSDWDFREKIHWNIDDPQEYPLIPGMDCVTYDGSGLGCDTKISSTGYHYLKSYNYEMDQLEYGSQYTAAAIQVYAEVLLNYAEAKAELGTITQNDLDISINQLRDRVNMPHMNLGNIVVDERHADDGIPPVIAEIRRERRIELIGMGMRYDDLIRWKQGKKLEEPTLGMRWESQNIQNHSQGEDASVQTTTIPGRGTYINVYKGTPAENPVFDESKHYLWPIPLSALSQNPELGQNPGW